MADATQELQNRVTRCLERILSAGQMRNDYGTLAVIVDEFSDALADFKRNFTNEALALAAAQYVPPVAMRNVVSWQWDAGQVMALCDDGTWWWTTGEKWVQVPSIPNTVPE